VVLQLRIVRFGALLVCGCMMGWTDANIRYIHSPTGRHFSPG